MFIPPGEPRLALTCDDVQMEPGYSIVPSRELVELKPYVFSAPMDRVTGYQMTKALLEAGEMPVLSRGLADEEWRQVLVEFGNHPNLWIAVPGETTQLLDYLEKIEASGHNKPARQPWNLAVDIAVGHGVVADKAYEILREISPRPKIMSGSIATVRAAEHCYKEGCTHLRVGIGPGSMCTTRKVTGFGVPQWSAINEIWEWVGQARRLGWRSPIVIADGGIRGTDDVAKLLAGGADAVMFGSILARCKESPGWVEVLEEVDLTDGVFRPGRNKSRLVKEYRGHASESFQQDNGKRIDAPEGVSTLITWGGEDVQSTLARHRAALRSAISYGGVASLSDFNPTNIQFRQVTLAGQIEATPHGVSHG